MQMFTLIFWDCAGFWWQPFYWQNANFICQFLSLCFMHQRLLDINRCREFTSSSSLMSYAHICWDEAVIIYWQNTDCQRMAAIILCQNWIKHSGISLQSVEQLLISWSWKMAIIYLKISTNELRSYMLRYSCNNLLTELLVSSCRPSFFAKPYKYWSTTLPSYSCLSSGSGQTSMTLCAIIWQ